MIQMVEKLEACVPFEVNGIKIEPGDILTLAGSDQAQNGRLIVENENGQRFPISPTFYRLCHNLTSQGWYLGSICRDEAARVLADKNTGAFLIRETEKNSRDHVKTLVIKTMNSLRNYRIYRKRHYFIVEERLFETLVDLVSYYWETGDGLTVHMELPGSIHAQPKMIDSQFITMSDFIGKGHFGEVYKGILNGGFVALKKVRDKSNVDEMSSRQQLKDEARLWHRLHHDSIVKFIGMSNEGLIIAELMDRGSLQSYLRSNEDSITLAQQLYWMSDLISAVVYLRQMNVIHRDVAARNILLNQRMKAKLSDFGMAIQLDDDVEYYEMSEQQKLPVRWLSPEASARWRFSFASDMWAVAVTMFEICSRGERPYKDLHNKEIHRVVKTGLRLSSESFGSVDQPGSMAIYIQLHQLMIQCWEKEAENRLTVMDLDAKFKRLFKRYLIK
jgi:hypothetical protein